MIETITTLGIAAIPAIIAGFASYIVSKKKSETEISKLQVQNENELDKLMHQHEVDLDSFRAAHKLELEKMDCDHKYQMEIIELTHQNELQRKSKELEDTAKYQAINSITSQLVPNLFGILFDSPEIKEMLQTKVMEGVTKKPCPE